MTNSARRDWKSPTLIGFAVLALGSGVMGTEWALKKQAPGIPGWTSFTGTTVGDTLLLPVLAASLLAVFRYLPATGRGTDKHSLAVGGFIGVVGGLAVQLSWLLDNRPRLSWVLPSVHHFSTIGYYHAIFLCVVSGTLFSLAFGASHRARHMFLLASPKYVRQLVRSPLVFLMVTCIWTFTVLTVQGGGAGISNVATIGSVVLPSLLVILLCFYALGIHWMTALPVLGWSLIFTSMTCSIIIEWPSSIIGILGLIVALSLTSGISFRDSNWLNRITESLIIGAAAVCFIVLPLGDPEALARNFLLALCVVPVVAIVTARGPLVDKTLVAPCSRRDLAIIAVLATSVSIAAWLYEKGTSGVAIGAFAIFAISFIINSLLLPWYRVEMRRITDSEAAHQGVTSNPELSALAKSVAFRGASWGITAIAVLLGIVISAGPSMGFTDGAKIPAMDLWLGLATLLTALGTVATACFTRRSHLAPAAVVIGSLAVFGLVIASLAEAPHHPWWLPWAAFGGALVGIWQVESIAGNAAMRPRWLVRREWRHAVACSVALAVGSLTLAECTNGMISSSGGPAESLASLLILFSGVLIGLMLVVAAGWSLDWQPNLIATGRAITSGQDVGEPNWARYRLRGCLLMDFGLIQGLTTVGIWIPSLALAHIGLSSQDRFFNTTLMTGTVMLFFVPMFTWTLRNSVKHVREQSKKAHRQSPTLFYGTLPYVSLHEERVIARNILRDREGPVKQKYWAAALAVHQLHLNLVAIAIALISLVGALGVLVLIITDFASEGEESG
jgi:hypothetical protein